jgi:hypothetical protein
MKINQHIKTIKEIGKEGKIRSEPMGEVCSLVDSNISEELSASIFRVED